MREQGPIGSRVWRPRNSAWDSLVWGVGVVSLLVNEWRGDSIGGVCLAVSAVVAALTWTDFFKLLARPSSREPGIRIDGYIAAVACSKVSQAFAQQAHRPLCQKAPIT